MATEQSFNLFYLRSRSRRKSLHWWAFLSPGLSAVISAETNTSSPELLARYDSDKDGSITFEELKAAVEKADNLT